MKSEYQNPKYQTIPNEIRILKRSIWENISELEIPYSFLLFRISKFGFRIFFPFVSDFGFRYSDFLLVPLVLFVLCTCTLGAEQANGPGEQDLILLGPLEPIRLRLIVEIDGQPFRTVWRNVFDRLFDQFDTDHDRRVSAEQAQQLSAVFVRESPVNPNAEKPANSAMMRDATVTREELRTHIERLAPPLVLRQRLSSGGAGPALIPLLDSDGDRRLSRAELEAAEQSLHCRDFNDDQLIIEQELLAGPTMTSATNSDDNGVGNGSVILLNASLDAGSVAEILLARYDRNRDGVLSLMTPAEILSTEGRLASLDVDQNQSLDRAELRRFLELPLDATLPLYLGSSGAGQKRAEALPQYRLRRKLDGGYRIHFGTSEIDFRRNNRDPSQDNARPRLSEYDADMNMYLDATEFMNVPDRPELAVVDSDRDGKVTETEFDAFFLNRSRAAAAQLVLEVSDQGSDLFTALDRNFDRVLTPRELHLASKLLETEDRDGDGFLGGVEMSYNLLLEISRGGSRPPTANNVIGMRGSADPQVKADRSGPNWFTKMDRNRDGDVSLTEFAGNRASFNKLDHDGDGLISISEATSAKKSP